MDAYLAPSPLIDSDHPDVARLAAVLAGGLTDPVAVVRACFEWVRDEVTHTVDAGGGPVTCRASQVLAHRTGYCYAKSHLLAALLRANGLPAGLCYQRLGIDDSGAPYCLHGLNAVWLSGWGWCRLDPRGDKPGIVTRFEPPIEYLAYRPALPGEADLAGVRAEPLRVVVDALTRFDDWRDVAANLPDALSL